MIPLNTNIHRNISKMQEKELHRIRSYICHSPMAHFQQARIIEHEILHIFVYLFCFQLNTKKMTNVCKGTRHLLTDMYTIGKECASYFLMFVFCSFSIVFLNVFTSHVCYCLIVTRYYRFQLKRRSNVCLNKEKRWSDMFYINIKRY